MLSFQANYLLMAVNTILSLWILNDRTQIEHAEKGGTGHSVLFKMLPTDALNHDKYVSFVNLFDKHLSDIYSVPASSQDARTQ